MHFAHLRNPDELQRDKPVIGKLFNGDIKQVPLPRKDTLTKNKEILWES